MTERDLEDFTMLAAFLVHLEKEDPQTMWGGHRIIDVIDALERLHDLPKGALRRLYQ